MMEHYYKHWLIRQIRYPVWNPVGRLVTQNKTEVIYRAGGYWPTIEEMLDVIDETVRVFGVRPDIIVAHFPTTFRGVDVR